MEFLVFIDPRSHYKRQHRNPERPAQRPHNRPARGGLNFYGGVLGLDTSSNVVPASGLHGDRAFADQALFPDPESLRIVAWLEKTASVLCLRPSSGARFYVACAKGPAELGRRLPTCPVLAANVAAFP